MKVILFDGVCNLCNSSVNWLIDRDKKNLFHFSSLQSAYGQKLVQDNGLTGNYMDTFVLNDDGKIYLRSEAALRVLRYLGGVYYLAGVFLIVPQFVRDGVYNWVAANRYKWFGKSETCRIPTPELKTKFME